MRMRGSERVVDRRWFVAGLIAAGLLAAVPARAQNSFDDVVAGLKARDASTRLDAVRALKDAGHVEAAAPLAVALADPDDRVVLAAIDAERALFVAPSPARRRMIGFVVEVRSSAAGAQAVAMSRLSLLPRRVPAEVLVGLADALGSANPRIRLDALAAFGELASLRGPSAAEAMRRGASWLVEALRRGNQSEQLAAAAAAGRAFENCGAATVQPDEAPLCAQIGDVLIETVNSRDADVRRAAMSMLGALRYSNAAQALSDQLGYYRGGADGKAALEGLAGIGHVTSIDIFKRQLSSSDADIRRLAVEGLARAGAREELPTLEQMARTERSNGVMLALHYATIALGAPAAPDQLIAALRDQSLRPLAVRYLLELGPSVAPALAASLQDPQPDTRAIAADILGFSRSAAVIPELTAAANDSDPDAARAAARALEHLALEGGAVQSAPVAR